MNLDKQQQLKSIYNIGIFPRISFNKDQYLDRQCFIKYTNNLIKIYAHSDAWFQF